MNFNSLSYFIFLPLTVSITFLLPQKYRKYWMLLVSFYFYACQKPPLLLLLLFSTVVDYSCALLMERFSQKNSLRKVFLLCSTITNLGLLSYFKYFGQKLFLPVGISFYTFQTMSYSIDVYRGDFKPEHDFITFALYVSFFPQLVAGPIESPLHLLPQLRENIRFSRDDIYAGMKYLLCGYFRKYVIADQCGIVVDLVFADISHMNAAAVLTGGTLFCFQMYNDFAGYSLIAVGSARLLGIRLIRNFDHPYRSQSYSEFFRRWHISLNKWFTSYLYIPLGGSRGGTLKKIRNIVIVFSLCGLWHGARLTYVLWGLYAAFWICIESLFLPGAEKALTRWGVNLKSHGIVLFRRFYMFLIFIPAAFFFRATGVDQVVMIFKKLLMADYSLKSCVNMLNLDLFYIVQLLLAGFCIDQLEDFDKLRQDATLKVLVKVSYSMICIILCCLCLLEGGGISGFAYFQF